MLQFDEKHITNLSEIYNFLQAYVDYHEGDPLIADDGEPTDCANLKQWLPSLQAVIKSKKVSKPKPIVKEKIVEVEIPVIDENDVYNAVKKARESVNPNYKYCVVYADAGQCGLTDDIGVAMEHAAAVSKTRRLDIVNVCRISKIHDGTYKTIIEGWCCDGHYDEVHGMCKDYLHFDFIAQRANVYKI